MEILKDLAPIKISDSALRALQEVLDGADTKENSFLRIGVRNGGCAGFSYILEYDVKGDNDMVYTIGDITFITDRDHVEYLSGTLIDYENGLKNRGFIYTNPNAKTTCGCGTSFG